jgi:hypothetical protein
MSHLFAMDCVPLEGDNENELCWSYDLIVLPKLWTLV